MKIFDALGRLQRLYDWERCMWRMKGISRRYLLTRNSSEWGWVGQLNGYTWKARCYSADQIPRIFAILRSCPRHSVADLNQEALTNLKRKKYETTRGYAPPLKFPDLAGGGVWRATPWRGIRQIWGQVEYLLSGSVAGVVLPIIKELCDFARLRAVLNRGFEPQTSHRASTPSLVT